MLRDQIERYNQRLRDFEDKQRVYRSHQQLDRPGDTDIEVSLVSTIFIWLKIKNEKNRRGRLIYFFQNENKD